MKLESHSFQNVASRHRLFQHEAVNSQNIVKSASVAFPFRIGLRIPDRTIPSTRKNSGIASDGAKNRAERKNFFRAVATPC